MAFNDDEKPPASNLGSTKGLVAIKEPTYSRNDLALTADEVTVVLELNATSSTAVREGLDLVAALDVSSSMRGEKLASMKNAMQFVIMKLTPVDRLSIVAFSNSARRHCPLRSVTQLAQADLRAIVDGLVVGSGANIESGIDTALAVIAGRCRSTTKTRIASVFLMSDGRQDNNTDARRPDPGKVSVHTFGFGKDGDHRLLSDVAMKSPGGTFSSVPNGQNVIQPFSQLLDGLLTVVAQDVQLTLTPKTDEPRDVDTLSVAPGTDYTHTTDGATGVITIKFGTLFSGETRKITVNLTLLDSDEPMGYDALLAEVQHGYTAHGCVQVQTPKDILILRTPKFDPAAVSRMAQAVLAEIMARRQYAGLIGEARELADGKNLDEARYKLVDAMKTLRDIGGLDKKLAGMVRAELLQLLVRMESQELYEAEGRPYGLASQMSHGRQRYAVRGSDMDNVRIFATPRMDSYLKQARRVQMNSTAGLPSAADDVREEITANPFAAFSAPIVFRLKAATLTPQEIENLTAPAHSSLLESPRMSSSRGSPTASPWQSLPK